MSKPERRWPFFFAIGVMLITCLPYLLAYSRQGMEWSFSGFLFAAEDGNSYLANMQSGSAGDWMWRSPYTTYPQNGAIVFVFYLLLGKLALSPAPHTELVLLYHLLRVVSGVLAILATYDFLSLFLKEVRYRRLGTALVTLGGGLGWVILVFGKTAWLGSLPLEFISPEAFGFLSLFGLAHLVLSRAFLLWGLRSYLLARQEKGKQALKGSLRTGVFWLLTGLAQPLTGMIVGAVPALHLLVTGVWTLYQKHRDKAGRSKPELLPTQTNFSTPIFSFDSQDWLVFFKRFWIAGLVAGPFVLYNALAFNLDPFLKLWNQQSAIPSPNPLLYLLAYCLVIPFALVGSITLLRRDAWQAAFLIPWIVVFLIAIYLPFSLQRRLLDGIWVAWVALAGVALEAYQRNGSIKWNWIKRLSPILTLSFIAPIILLVGGSVMVLSPSQPWFQPRDETAVFSYLAQHARPGEVVLSSYQSGNVLPAWAPVRVVVGLGTLTANIATLLPQVESFYQPSTDDTERQAFLVSQGVAYVFWGPDEQVLGSWDPHQAAYMQEIFSQGKYHLFKVIRI
jgi:hypothetical protein